MSESIYQAAKQGGKVAFQQEYLGQWLPGCMPDNEPLWIHLRTRGPFFMKNVKWNHNGTVVDVEVDAKKLAYWSCDIPHQLVYIWSKTVDGAYWVCTSVRADPNPRSVNLCLTFKR